MLRIERSPAGTTLVSRLARLRVLAVLAAVLAGAALAASGSTPRLAAALGIAAALLALLGGRTHRARFERGRVAVRAAAPFRGRMERPLADFAGVRVETLGEARRRKAEGRARGWRERAGTEMPDWMRAPDAPGTNDALGRIVLVAREGEPLPVTSWLAEDDVEAARAEVEGLLS